MNLNQKYNHDAIVLIGRRNAGKDTVFRELDALLPDAYNVKFSRLSKDLVSRAIDVSPALLEDKDARVKNICFNGCQLPVSSVDIVNALYFGGEKQPEIIDAAVEYAIDMMPFNVLPVFTDIRRTKEIQTILRMFDNPLFILLDADNREPYLPEDSLAQQMQLDAGVIGNAAYVTYSKRNTTANWIADDLAKTLGHVKVDQRLLFLYANAEDAYRVTATLYEPLLIYVKAVDDLSNRVSMSQAEKMQMFHTLTSMFSKDDISLQPLNIGKNHMIYFPKQHKPLLPRLLKMADKVYYIGFDKGDI